MLSSRKILILVTTGFAGGLIGSLFILPFLLRVNFLNTAAILSNLAAQSQPSQPPTIVEITKDQPAITPQLNYFSEAIGKIKPSIVAIQSFSGGALIRYGSGIILTQDGLIVTLNYIVPANADVIQVTNASKIYKAKVVFRDYNKNIALISITVENNLQVVRLKSELLVLGQKLLVFAEIVDFSEDKPLVAEVLVSQTDEKNNQFKILLPYEPNFYGAAVADNNGTILGLLDFRNQKPLITYSKTIENILNAYLTATKK